MSSLYKKNFLITTSLLLVSLFVLGLTFMVLGRGFIMSERREGMTAAAEEVVKSALAFRQEGSEPNWELRMTISSISRTTDNHIFITDEDGVVTSCSDMQLACEHIGQIMPSSVINTLAAEDSYSQISDLDGFYSETRYIIGMPIADAEGDAEGYVFISSDSGPLMDAWRTLLSVFLIIAGAVMVLALICSYITSKSQAKPLNEMAAAAQKFAHGDFSVRVTSKTGTDEIQALTEAFNAMADSLERSEKLRSDFVANVSHELKTPMTTISGFADGILDGTIPPERQGKYLAIISSETKRLSRLVRSMLDLSRIQSANPLEIKVKSFDITEVLRVTLLGLEGKITDKALDVDAQIPEESMTVCGDADGITQVVYNLLDNAIKFSEPGGEIGLALWKTGSKAFVCVRNSGETISPEELPKIFDRFHKADKSRSRDKDGAGLGLYIVKSILGNHGEDITVSSQNGKTEFIFTLSLKEAAGK